MSGKLLTTKEVEKLIQLNRVTIYRLIREENFPAVKLGGQWRFPEQQVQEWLATHGYVSRPTPPSPPPAPAQTLEQLFNSIEVVTLLNAFATSMNLSVTALSADGIVLVDCPSCRHPVCQFVQEASQDGDMCLAHRNPADLSQKDPQRPHIFDCVAGLKYLQAPVEANQKVIAYVMMGPIMTGENTNADVIPMLNRFATQTGSDREALRQHFQQVQQFSMQQVHILVQLLSQVISTMLEVVSGRSQAIARLNEIAQLAAAESKS